VLRGLEEKKEVFMPKIRLDIALYWVSIIFLLTALLFQRSEVTYLQEDVSQLQAMVKKIERVEVDNESGKVSFAVKALEGKNF